jgi:hypothetical protein
MEIVTEEAEPQPSARPKLEIVRSVGSNMVAGCQELGPMPTPAVDSPYRNPEVHWFIKDDEQAMSQGALA